MAPIAASIDALHLFRFSDTYLTFQFKLKALWTTKNNLFKK